MFQNFSHQTGCITVRGQKARTKNNAQNSPKYAISSEKLNKKNSGEEGTPLPGPYPSGTGTPYSERRPPTKPSGSAPPCRRIPPRLTPKNRRNICLTTVPSVLTAFSAQAAYAQHHVTQKTVLLKPNSITLASSEPAPN